MSSSAEIVRLKPPEAYRTAMDLKKQAEDALRKNPGFLDRVADIFLFQSGPGSRTNNIPPSLQWEEGKTRFVVSSRRGRSGEESLTVNEYTGPVAEGFSILVDPNVHSGEFRWSITHISGQPIDASSTDQKATDNIKSFIKKLNPSEE